MRYEGIFPIIAKVGSIICKVELLDWLNDHHVFHVSNLQPYHPNKKKMSPQPSEETINFQGKSVMKMLEKISVKRVIASN